LGVSRIVPLVSERLVVKFKGETREKVVSRWRRIARESGAQSRRTYGVEIASPVRVSDVPEDVAVADFDGGSDWSGVRAVAIGPEGGWGHEEWSPARRRLTLGPTVLRGETAGVVAASILAFGAGEWGFTGGASSNG
jgi:16S rRNA (uracil1498-N3)-methyltransferase